MGLADWWKRLLGDAPSEATTEAPRALAALEAEELDPAAPAREVGSHALSEKLTVREYAHAMASAQGPLAVRTFLSEGLEALGATEVRVSVPASWDAELVEMTVEYFRLLERLATEGRPAVVGSVTGFRSPLLGEGMVGTAYAWGGALPGIPGSSGALVSVLFDDQEFVLLQRGLATRLLGRLAARERVFPYPAWWEMRDEPALTEQGQAPSLLEKCPRLGLGDARATLSDERALVLSLPPHAKEELAKTFERQEGLEVLALTTARAPSADGQFVWEPGAREATVVAAGQTMPERVALAFVVLLARGEDELKVLEDGAALMLSPERFEELREALCEGRELELPLSAGRSLRVVFRPLELEDPLTGARLRSQSGWERYLPRAEGGLTGERTRVLEVLLLVPEARVEERVSVVALAEYLKALFGAAEAAAERVESLGTTRFAAGFALDAGEPARVAVRVARGGSPELEAALTRALEGVKAPEVTGHVAARLELEVLPGAKRVLH